MRKNLVIEGPDGSGKTTLISQLRERYPELPEPTRAASSTGGPYPNMACWIDADVLDTTPKLYDRHPLISGPIYERGAGIPQTFQTSGPGYDYHLRRLYTYSSVVICLPELETVVANLDAEPQLSGVRENIDAIWQAYYEELANGATWYDYEDREDFASLCYYIEGDVL